MDEPAVVRRRAPLLLPSLVAVLLAGGIVAFAVLAGRLDPIPGPYQPTSTFADGVGFSYPSTWAVISRGEGCGLHGDYIVAAVGTGFITIPRREEAFRDGNLLTCLPISWVVAPDRIVVADIQAILPGPGIDRASGLEPDEERALVGGRAAGYSETATSRTWRFLDALEWIEARWGVDVPERARQQVDDLIRSWTWPPG